jgi:electron transfer flavoprotein beta subunit
MDIVVCVKQVIAGDQVRFNSRTHTLVRTAEVSRVNPFDLCSLDMAVRLKKEYGGSITAVTMGPKIGEEVLWEALAVGADRAVLLCDPRFAGSDTLATSYVLGLGIRKIGRFDVILCGMRTADSDTGQVGPQLAEELGITSVSGVEKIEWKGDLFRLERVSDEFREVIEVPSPLLCAVSTKSMVRLPSLTDIQDSFVRTSIDSWNLEAIGADPTRVGSEGSCTWVEKLVPVTEQKTCVFIDGDPRQQARTLFSKLIVKDLIS